MATHPSIRIEGGLLGPDLLDKLMSGDLPGQRTADFGIEGKRNLTDEIATAFADARAMWGVFQSRLSRLDETDIGTTVTRDAWMVPFFGLLGYEPRYNPRALEVDGLSFAVSHRAGEPEDAPPIHIVGARQELGRVAASGKPRLAPHSLVQEYLNRTEHVWGLVTNGLTIRLLRDSTLVRRQAYVEFDLEAMIEEQRFQDFAALYRLIHRTRLPKQMADAGDCLLEQYHTQSIEQGGRVRDHLRDGVEKAIDQLANGFLRHPVNDDLRRRVLLAADAPNRISGEALYRQLLRLVYRFLFLLVSEDRCLISDSVLYRDHYSIARLRRLLDQRAAWTDHDDLWQSLRVLFYLLRNDSPQTQLGGKPLASTLGLPVLNGELFEGHDLDDCTIRNEDLLGAVWNLAYYEDKPAKGRGGGGAGSIRRVNYAALDVEELGSVYESLLEFHPAVEADPADAQRRPRFQLVYGSARKTTGSYYTPPELVGELIRSALEPVIDDRLAAVAKTGAKPNDKSAAAAKEKALLSIRVCDPACGSGHFLLAAARRLGKELAKVRTGEDEPAPERVREAIRDVVSHCIYGVDRNPLAVDLCRVALWLESHAEGRPLTFLDHRIRCGDSLIGVFNLEVLKSGIPDKAFEPLEGDDKAVARALASQNRDEREGQAGLFPTTTDLSLDDFTRDSAEVDAIVDDTPEAVRRKRRLFEAAHQTPEWRRKKDACDLWAAAFFQPLRPNDPGITTGAVRDRLGGRPLDGRIQGNAMSIALSQRFFHWPLEFPGVFSTGGFDVILSNPPWERIKLQEQEFFAARDARIAHAESKAARAKLLKSLPEANPSLHREYVEALRAASAAGTFFRQSTRYPLTGRGDINTYAVFAELVASASKRDGRAGLILPKGIATDDTTKLFFGALVDTGRVISLIGFENEDFIFPAIDHRVTFCCLVLGGGAFPVERSRIAFYIRKFPQLSEQHRFFELDRSDFWLLNPNTGNCPIFRTAADAELTKAIYRRVPVLWNERSVEAARSNAWRLSFKTLLHMANDSHHFRAADDLRIDGYQLIGNVWSSAYDRYLPLYEAKMLQQFDHRFSTYDGATDKQLNVGILPQPSGSQKKDPAFVVQPRYWVREEVVNSVIPRYPEPLALALRLDHRPSIQRILCYWAAGNCLLRGHESKAQQLLKLAIPFDLDRPISSAFGQLAADAHAIQFAQDFPLSEADVEMITAHLAAPEAVAQQLVERFSPDWLMGWRDITNATNERTMIAALLPRAAVGHTFPLMFFPTVPARRQASLLANLNSLVADYVARQKVGGTHITYNLLKQFAVLAPSGGLRVAGLDDEWIATRVLELVYTSDDLTPFARAFGYQDKPFKWDDERRFEMRCELDAAFFHLYFSPSSDGSWQRVASESPQHLAELGRHFPTVRDAVAFILEQFPITREKEERATGVFRTRNRVLALFDAMLEAARIGQPFKSALIPAPGVQR